VGMAVLNLLHRRNWKDCLCFSRKRSSAIKRGSGPNRQSGPPWQNLGPETTNTTWSWLQPTPPDSTAFKDSDPQVDLREPAFLGLR
jgi:hypothetical protein